MASHGGYRKPSHPASVSGPGALSKRTDGGPQHMQLTDAGYGEQQSFQQDQQGAPMGGPAAPGGGPAPLDLSGLVPLGAPSQYPDEPTTAGAAAGPGVGPEAIGLGQGQPDQQDAERLRAYLPALMEMAARDDSSQSFRNAVRTLRNQLR